MSAPTSLPATGCGCRSLGKVKQLAYDYRWMARSEWLRPYLLLPMVRKYNEQCLRELGNAA